MPPPAQAPGAAQRQTGVGGARWHLGSLGLQLRQRQLSGPPSGSRWSPDREEGTVCATRRSGPGTAGAEALGQGRACRVGGPGVAGGRLVCGTGRAARLRQTVVRREEAASGSRPGPSAPVSREESQEVAPRVKGSAQGWAGACRPDSVPQRQTCWPPCGHRLRPVGGPPSQPFPPSPTWPPALPLRGHWRRRSRRAGKPWAAGRCDSVGGRLGSERGGSAACERSAQNALLRRVSQQHQKQMRATRVLSRVAETVHDVTRQLRAPRGPTPPPHTNWSTPGRAALHHTPPGPRGGRLARVQLLTGRACSGGSSLTGRARVGAAAGGGSGSQAPGGGGGGWQLPPPSHARHAQAQSSAVWAACASGRTSVTAPGWLLRSVGGSGVPGRGASRPSCPESD